MVWVGIEDDEFVCGHMGVWKKVQNIRNDPRVALSLLGTAKNAIGLQEYLVVYGQARITEGGCGGAAPATGARLSWTGGGVSTRTVPQPARLHHAHHTAALRRRWAVESGAGLSNALDERR